MLSYQHAYHAGNAADLHKHCVLAELLARLTVKPRGIAYMETHAGRGLYDLAGPEAARTGEAARGIGRADPDGGSSYGKALAATRARHGPAAYPGSPLIAAALLRPQDRMILFELHPAEHAALRRAFGRGGPPASIHRRDGWEGALALSPPEPRRGLVLVDPSYEVKTEYRSTAASVRRLVARWPQAVVLVWYPILAAGRHAELAKGLAPLAPLRDERRIVDASGGMVGTGLFLVNAPHGAAGAFTAAQEIARGVLAPSSP